MEARFSQQRLLLGVDLTVVLDLELDRWDMADLALVRGPRAMTTFGFYRIAR